MPIECVWFDSLPDGPWRPGYCFPFGYQLSEHFKAHVASTRPAISVCVPMRNDTDWEVRHPGERRGTVFCIDAHPTDKPHGAWEVTVVGDLVAGEKPDISVHPSMNAVDIYHGWLANGILSDDSP